MLLRIDNPEELRDALSDAYNALVYYPTSHSTKVLFRDLIEKCDNDILQTRDSGEAGLWKDIPTFPSYQITRAGDIRWKFDDSRIKVAYVDENDRAWVELMTDQGIYTEPIADLIRVTYHDG